MSKALLDVLWHNAADSKVARKEIAQQTKPHRGKADPDAVAKAKTAQERRGRKS